MYLGPAGMVCAVGLHAAAACAAMRAGIAGFEELPYWDSNSAPVVGAAVPSIDLDLQFGPRLIELLLMALCDCLAHAQTRDFRSVPLLVGLAEPGRPGGGAELAKSIVPTVQDRLGVEFHTNRSKTFATGHTAAFEALAEARQLLRAGEATGCLLCVVDSYINASSLFWLDQQWRLKRPDHIDGVIPGEAAAVLYVRRHAPARARTTVELVGLGFGVEKASVLSGRPLLGRGLSDACRAAFRVAGWGFHHIDFRVSDMTGENYSSREHALAEGRLARVVRKEPQPLWHPADSIGDTGAASGLIQLIMAATAWEKSYAPGNRAACFTSALTGGRAVALLQRKEEHA